MFYFQFYGFPIPTTDFPCVNFSDLRLVSCVKQTWQTLGSFYEKNGNFAANITLSLMFKVRVFIT